MPGPLEGLRVIDFGQYLAGPFGPMLLGDLGADVIKVEPTRGDGMRSHVVGSFMGCQAGQAGHRASTSSSPRVCASPSSSWPAPTSSTTT